jgi:uncharacterized protein
MKEKPLFIAILLLTGPLVLKAQTGTEFKGVEATQARYKAVYQLNNDQGVTIRATLRNIQNALNDPRLQDRLTIELVAHGAGATVFYKDKPYGE